MIPPSVQALIDIFDRELADLRFGDMDSKALARIATDVETAANAVNAAQAALDAARGKLLERQEALLQQAQRALAYTRIYAENNDTLRAQLDEIVLPRPAKRPKVEASTSAMANDAAPPSAATDAAEIEKPRRGRRRKSESETAEDAAAE